MFRGRRTADLFAPSLLMPSNTTLQTPSSASTRPGRVPARRSARWERPLAAGAALMAALAAHGQVPFTEESSVRGLIYPMQGYPPGFGFYGTGCGAADLDGDGDQDVILLGRSTGQVGIFENDGSGHFTDRSAPLSGIANLPGASSFATADYDGDGIVDIFITRVSGGTSRLYRGLGNLTYQNVTGASGIDTTGRLSKCCAWGDFDNDGWVDLYVGNYVFPTSDRTLLQNQLFRNKGDGTFEEVGVALGVASDGATLQPVWTDADRDGWLDLYLSNDRGPYPEEPPNQFFRNTGGGFMDLTDTCGAGGSLFSMGLACGDWNRDGWPDFYCTNTTDVVAPLMGAFPLYLSTGPGQWMEGQDAWGVAFPSTPAPGGSNSWGWGCLFFDWNNDGWQDLFVCLQFDAERLYQGGPTPPAVDVAPLVAVTGPNSLSTYGCAVLDADGDGDLDLLGNPMGANVTLRINHEGETRAWVRFRVKGRWPNTAAIGAAVEGFAGSDRWYQEILAGGNNYLGQNEQVIHFGLGSNDHLDTATVRWPSGGPTRPLSSVPAGHTWMLIPPEDLGDANGDGVVDAADRLLLCRWLGAAVQPGREPMDFDGNWTIDGADADAFAAAHGHVASDLDGDGHVGGADLGQLLAGWGGSSCAADINGDGSVNGADLGILLSNWG